MSEGAIAPQRAQFRHAERLRVRWAEVDLQRIVFNGHYLMYFDTAVAGWWRAMALPYEATMSALGGDLYVRRAALEYEASARYDETLEVCVRCARIGTSSMRLDGAVFREGRRLVTAELVYVYADPATQTSAPLPPALREVIEAYEAGAPMLQVSADPATGEAVARNRLGRELGRGRLSPAKDGSSHLDTVVVDEQLRGAGVGTAVLQALVQQARERADGALIAQPPAHAVGWLRRAGFVPGEAGGALRLVLGAQGLLTPWEPSQSVTRP